MAQTEDPTGVIALATEEIAPIEEELRRRLTVAVGERDVLAIETALLKAFISGMATANSEAVELQIEQAGTVTSNWVEPQPAPAQPQPELPHLDPWAARYGSGG